MELYCPQCGAQIPSIEESGFVKCEYCDTTLYVDLTQAAQHYYYSLQIKKSHLWALLTRWLALRELNKGPKPLDIKLVYFPFWRIARGKKTLFLPAASFHIEEISEMRIPGGDFKLYEKSLEDDNEVIPPDIFLDSVLENHQEELTKIEGKASMFLVHVPLYMVRYQYGSGEYEIVIEGVQGQIFTDDIPPQEQLKMDSVFTAVMIAAIAVFAAEFYFIPGFLKPLIIAVITAIPLHFLLSIFLLKRF